MCINEIVFFLWYINSIFYSTVKTQNVEDYGARVKLILRALFKVVLGSHMFRKEITAFARSGHSQNELKYKLMSEHNLNIMFPFSKTDLGTVRQMNITDLPLSSGFLYTEKTNKTYHRLANPKAFLLGILSEAEGQSLSSPGPNAPGWGLGMLEDGCLL